MLLDCKVTAGTQLKERHWQLQTTRGILQAEAVVNAAGLFGDIVEKISSEPNFRS